MVSDWLVQFFIASNTKTVVRDASQPVIFCHSGDASLTHGGGRSLLIEIFASLRDQHLGLCMIIIDNGGSASTGGQALTSNLTQHLPVEMVQSISYSDTSEDRFFSLFKTAQSQKRLVLIHLRV